jgi:hypothetical protein
VVRSSGKDNIYHDRETTKSRRSDPAGTKDANIRKSKKDQQFEYQQERCAAAAVWCAAAHLSVVIIIMLPNQATCP